MAASIKRAKPFALLAHAADLLFVKAPRHLFSIAGDKGDGVPFVKELDNGRYL